MAINFGTPNQQGLDRLTMAEAKQYLAEGMHSAKDSMAHRILAIRWLLEAGGKHAIITTPENIGLAPRGEIGTHIFRRQALSIRIPHYKLIVMRDG